MSQEPENLVWLDLEMTGLDPDRCTILEIATIVTDSHLNVIAEGPALPIHHEREGLETIEVWSQRVHTKSGLLQRVASSTVSLQAAEAQTLAFVKQHVGKQKSPLCGNSIHHDRKFLERYMPKLSAYFHYRNVDVSTVKELVRRWYPQGGPVLKKKRRHLAADDIRESIEELVFYREHYFLKR